MVEHATPTEEQDIGNIIKRFAIACTLLTLSVLFLYDKEYFGSHEYTALTMLVYAIIGAVLYKI